MTAVQVALMQLFQEKPEFLWSSSDSIKVFARLA